MGAVRPSTMLIGVPALLVGGGIVSAAGLFAQAAYAVRRPLPTFSGSDISTVLGPPEGPHVDVVALGDSGLTGPGLDGAEQVWLRRSLRAAVADTGAQVMLRSVAIGGSRVADVVAEQLPNVAESGADLAVIALGGNDVIRVTPVPEFRRHLRTLVKGARSACREVLLVGVVDVGTVPRLPAPLRHVAGWRSRTLDGVVRQVAEEEGARYLDLESANAIVRADPLAMFCPDRFHCNATGHALLADLATPVISDAIRSLTGPTPAP